MTTIRDDWNANENDCPPMCPLLQAAETIAGGGYLQRCYGSGCAWWHQNTEDRTAGACALVYPHGDDFLDPGMGAEDVDRIRHPEASATCPDCGMPGRHCGCEEEEP